MLLELTALQAWTACCPELGLFRYGGMHRSAHGNSRICTRARLTSTCAHTHTHTLRRRWDRVFNLAVLRALVLLAAQSNHACCCYFSIVGAPRVPSSCPPLPAMAATWEVGRVASQHRCPCGPSVLSGPAVSMAVPAPCTQERTVPTATALEPRCSLWESIRAVPIPGFSKAPILRLRQRQRARGRRCGWR